VKFSVVSEPFVCCVRFCSERPLGNAQFLFGWDSPDVLAYASEILKDDLIWQLRLELIWLGPSFLDERPKRWPMVVNLRQFEAAGLAKDVFTRSPAQRRLAGAKNIEDFLTAVAHEK